MDPPHLDVESEHFGTNLSEIATRPCNLTGSLRPAGRRAPSTIRFRQTSTALRVTTDMRSGASVDSESAPLA